MAESKAPQVKKLIEAGLSVLEVAHSLRISPQAVYKHLATLGIDPPSKREGNEGEEEGSAA